jgi:hypothetical protein
MFPLVKPICAVTSSIDAAAKPNSANALRAAPNQLDAVFLHRFGATFCSQSNPQLGCGPYMDLNKARSHAFDT